MRRQLYVAARAFLLCALCSSSVTAQDFRVLQETRPPNPKANDVRFASPEGASGVRVLLAGDSWAQYMWDDGSHNDMFDRYGHGDKLALALSLGSDPGAGYTGPEYAISGSEARQWADRLGYPWIDNVIDALRANPDVDLVMLSIGGNDMLAGKSDGGWYKDMDLDLPGSEAALFAQLEQDSFVILDALWAERPELDVLLSSYDYPNFNLGFWCFIYACPKRRDLSRDPDNDLITDQELNQLMVDVESLRMGWANANPRLLLDHSIGLMHYYYGDGVSAPYALPYPGQDPPNYLPFPGGNPLRPTLRENFREPGGLDVDPIHLDYDGYRLKISNQTQSTFFPRFRGTPTETFLAQGNGRDGWTNGLSFGSDQVVIGDDATGTVYGILSFDTSSIPDGATVTSASVYLSRASGAGVNPFVSATMGMPTVDIKKGSFGAPELEASDAMAPADATANGWVAGSALTNDHAVRVEITGAGLAAINDQGLTQLRVYFPGDDGNATSDYAGFWGGDAPAPSATGSPSLARYMGSSVPFLDLSYELSTGVAMDGATATSPLLGRNTPNPFSASTTVRFALPHPANVSLAVYDLAGRRVKTLLKGSMPAGVHGVSWDGRDVRGRRVAAGVYMTRLVADQRVDSARMVLLEN